MRKMVEGRFGEGPATRNIIKASIDGFDEGAQDHDSKDLIPGVNHPHGQEVKPHVRTYFRCIKSDMMTSKMLEMGRGH